MDLVESGADLCTLLAAGGWRSSAFAAYLQMRAVEKGAVRAAALSLSGQDHSSDSEVEEGDAVSA